jgi:hypothetical protein
VPPEPRPVQFSTVLARSRALRARLRRCRRLRGSILDCRCARRSARGQVGTWRNRGTGSVLVPINANGARPCPQRICINMSVSTCP